MTLMSSLKSGVDWDWYDVAAPPFLTARGIAYWTVMVSVFFFVPLCCCLYYFVAFCNTLLFLYIYLQKSTMEWWVCFRWSPCFPVLFRRILVVHFSNAVVLMPSCCWLSGFHCVLPTGFEDDDNLMLMQTISKMMACLICVVVAVCCIEGNVVQFNSLRSWTSVHDLWDVNLITTTMVYIHGVCGCVAQRFIVVLLPLSLVSVWFWLCKRFTDTTTFLLWSWPLMVMISSKKNLRPWNM